MIGTKLAKPDKFCLNFMGDGAFGMSGLDIETSVRAGAPITTIVLNNGDMATYPGQYQNARELFNVTKMTGDYAKLAERSEEHTSELQSLRHLVCRLLLEKKN